MTEERLRFVTDWESGEWTMAELCRFYGVSRATGYKWADRHELFGIEGLKDLSRAPRHHPNGLEEGIERLIFELKGRYPHWGATKLRRKLETEYGLERVPAESTIGVILKRNGLTVPVARRRPSRTASAPLAHAGKPNEVWCADYKGWFRTGDHTRIDPLTMTDACSRFLFRCQGLPVADTLHTKPVMEAVFRKYGMPNRMRTDNGTPFASNSESGLTQLSVWWIKLGIIPERIRPGKPQENGRHERMHRTLKQETASPAAANRRAQQERFNRFVRQYNEERPHEALGLQTPAECYAPSERPYPERLREIEYPADWEIRRVSAGKMRWKCEHVFVSHALDGETVGLEQIEDDRWRVWFSFYEVGTLTRNENSIRRPQPSQ